MILFLQYSDGYGSYIMYNRPKTKELDLVGLAFESLNEKRYVPLFHTKVLANKLLSGIEVKK